MKTKEQAPSRHRWLPEQEQRTPPPVNASPFLRLQRAAGNQGMLRLFNGHTAIRTEAPPTVVSVAGAAQALLQRKCAQCPDEEETPRILQRTAAGATLQRKCAPCSEEDEAPIRVQRSDTGWAPGKAPDIVGEVLQSPGQALDSQTRAWMEPRLGHDFSGVRIHTDARAAESAAAVKSRAYTVGSNVVFAQGQYRPHSPAGQRLLAHELTHVVQQLGAANSSLARQGLEVGPHDDHFEREADRVAGEVMAGGGAAAPVSVASRTSGPMLSRDWFPCDDPPQCPARDEGERRRASRARLQVGELTYPENGEIVFGFDIGSSRATSLRGNATWSTFAANIAASQDRWEILGFTDCEGGVERNSRLRRERASAALAALPAAAQAKVDRAIAAPLTDCVAPNDTEQNRAHNRSVVFRRTLSHVDIPAEEIEGQRPSRICGPDITDALAGVLRSVETYFRSSGLSWWQKRRSCMALDPDFIVAFVNPIMAWDVRQLFLPNTSWLDSYFTRFGCGSPRDPACRTDPQRHSCETAGTCGNTVTVGGRCMLAGTANYALYGKMFQLCHDEFSPDFPRWDMRAMIWMYKKLTGDDPGPPGAMAKAAFDGIFPPTAPAAAEDRRRCYGRCEPNRYRGSFSFVWEPYRSR